MPKRKSLASIEKQIKLTQQRLLKVKTRYEKLGVKLIELNKEKTLRQAEVIAEAMAPSGKTMEELMTFLSR